MDSGGGWRNIPRADTGQEGEQMVEKIYFKPKELIEMGFPAKKVYQVARKVGRKSTAKRGGHYLLTLKEAKRCFE